MAVLQFCFYSCELMFAELLGGGGGGGERDTCNQFGVEQHRDHNHMHTQSCDTSVASFRFKPIVEFSFLALPATPSYPPCGSKRTLRVVGSNQQTMVAVLPRRSAAMQLDARQARVPISSVPMEKRREPRAHRESRARRESEQHFVMDLWARHQNPRAQRDSRILPRRRQ